MIGNWEVVDGLGRVHQFENCEVDLEGKSLVVYSSLVGHEETPMIAFFAVWISAKMVDAGRDEVTLN